MKKALHLYYKLYYTKNVDENGILFYFVNGTVMLMAVIGRYRPVARSSVIQTRMAPAERELVERAAKHESMTISAWVRAVLIESAKAELDRYDQ